MSFQYKTRGNISPQGKPRVYFCCHPKDFDEYFEIVANEILAKQTCAIWYADGDTARDEVFLEDLRQMQLFVVPVTTNLLCSPNTALDIELQFAVRNHIAVLPLMQERGLEELFNKKCGDLHFLDKNNTDATAISYDDKLQKYLEAVLIGDKFAEKIRAAFDTYVFLSYRKKDRKYAQELMRLIHKNILCRDIAIWYDEFLTPGESFNDSIKEAVQKSDLFVLTVTPNLVNEPNYIMMTEYPVAVQNGKIILPVELVPTDKSQLSKKYKDLPYVVDAHNEAELSKKLCTYLKKDTKKIHSAEREYYMGLAYLGGIGVEKDSNIAMDFITKAAEQGETEAMRKLSRMFFFSDGISKDINHSYFWYKLYIAALLKEFIQMPTIDKARKISRERLAYCLMLETDTTQSRDLSFSLAKQEYIENILFYKKALRDDWNNDDLLGELATGYYALGSFFEWQRCYNDAILQYEKAVKAYEKLLVIKHWRYSTKLSECYIKLIYLLVRVNSLQQSEEYVLSNIAMFQECSERTVNTEGILATFEWHYKKECAESHSIAAWFYEVTKNFNKAIEHYNCAIALYEEWVSVAEEDIHYITKLKKQRTELLRKINQ